MLPQHLHPVQRKKINALPNRDRCIVSRVQSFWRNSHRHGLLPANSISSRRRIIDAHTDGTIGGFLQTLSQPERQCTIVPTVAATACPGGLVLDSTYQSIKTDLLTTLATAQQDEGLDGILLALHGSAATTKVSAT